MEFSNDDQDDEADDSGSLERERKIALLWSACLLEDWTSETNTKTQRWYTSIQAALSEPSRMIELVAAEFPSFEDVVASGSKSSAIFKTLMAFNLAKGGNDWSGARRLPGVTLEDHHIFPKDWITNNKANTPDKQQWILVRDSVLNRVFVTRAANSSAKAQVPPNYLGQIGHEERRTLQIPDSFMGPLPVPIPFDDLNKYLKDRYDLMRQDFIDTTASKLRI